MNGGVVTVNDMPLAITLKTATDLDDALIHFDAIPKGLADVGSC